MKPLVMPKLQVEFRVAPVADSPQPPAGRGFQIRVLPPMLVLRSRSAAG
jgi:hypothetical protein